MNHEKPGKVAQEQYKNAAQSALQGMTQFMETQGQTQDRQERLAWKHLRIPLY